MSVEPDENWTFGYVRLLYPTELKDAGNHRKWACECLYNGPGCVKHFMSYPRLVRSGHTKSCGCKNRERCMQRKTYVDLAGTRKGRLLVVREAGINKAGNILWECLCNPEWGGCGTVKVIPSQMLVRGQAKSCSCLRADECAERFSKMDDIIKATRKTES